MPPFAPPKVDFDKEIQKIKSNEVKLEIVPRFSSNNSRSGGSSVPYAVPDVDVSSIKGSDLSLTPPVPPVPKPYAVKTVGSGSTGKIEAYNPYGYSAVQELGASAPDLYAKTKQGGIVVSESRRSQIQQEEAGFSFLSAFQGVGGVSNLGLRSVNLGSEALTGLGTKSIYQGASQVIPRAGSFVFQNLIPGATKALGTPLGKLATGIGVGVVTSQVAPPIAKGGFDVIAPSELTKEEQVKVSQEARKRTEQRITSEGINLPIFGQDVEKAFTANIIGSSVYGLPGGTFTVAPKYGEETKKVLMEKGYSQADAERIGEIETQREVYAGGAGEFAGLVVSAGTVGELVGRGTAKTVGGFLGGGAGQVLGKTGASVASTISGAIGGFVGGGVEGALMYPSQQQARYKQIDVGDWAFTTAISGATAGIAGGIIGGLSVQAPNAGKAFYNVLGVAEGGQEFVGDYGASKVVGEAFDLSFNVGGKATKVNVATHTPITGLTPASSPSASTSIANETPLFIPNQTSTPTSTQNLEIINLTSPTPSETISKTGSITPVPNPTPIPNESLTITELPTKEQTSTTTQTFTFTPTPTTAFTPTFTGKFIPFIPPIAGGGDWGHKATKRERTRFVDEFSAAFAGLAKPSEPTYFGKQSSISKTRKMFKPKKNKKQRGGFNYASIFV